MSGNLRDRTLALAGMFQATHLVHLIATGERLDETAFATTLHTIFVTDAENTDAVFGHPPTDLALGLKTLLTLCQDGNKDRLDVEIMQYVVGLFGLEKRLRDRPKVLRQLADGIQGIQRQVEHFSETHENVMAALADLYLKTIATLGPRIMVQGDLTILQEPANAARIRALLLAGIRAAVLWNQKGGGRLTLIFGRKKLAAMAKAILAEP